MTAKGLSIAPRASNLAPSPIASAGSPSSSSPAGLPRANPPARTVVAKRLSVSSSGSSASTPKPISTPPSTASIKPSSSSTHPSTHSSTHPSSQSTSIHSSTPASRAFPQIITSKEWVLPPRPKPGRKPSVDTPASKRKAQNRAAQRAFRERRATRVQELEEKLMEVEKENEIREMGLVNTVNKLKFENQFLMKSLDQLRADINSIKNSSNSQSPSHIGNTSSAPSPNVPMFSSQARPQQSLPQTQKVSPLQYASNSPATSNSSYSVQQISPAPSADSPPVFNNLNSLDPHSYNHAHARNNSFNQSHARHPTINLTPHSNNTTPDKPLGNNNNNNNNSSRVNNTANTVEFDCGICIKDECLCASVGLKDSPNPQPTEANLEETINSFKPMAAVSLKSNKKRKATDANAEQEIDFTKEFAVAKPMPDLKKLKRTNNNNNNSNNDETLLQSFSVKKDSEDFNESSPVENCGFCSDDTPCVCREAAKEAARLNESLNDDQQQQSRSHSHHHQHSHHQDGMIEEDEEADGETSLPPIQLNNNSFRKTSLPVMHPGPSVEIREITNLTPGAVPTVVRRNDNGESPESNNDNSTAESGGCTGNPGTCSQCQTDPMSTLFCATVANKVKEDENATATTPSMPAASPAREFGSKITSTPPAGITRNNSRTNISSITIPGGMSLSNPSTPLASTPGGTISSSHGMFIPCADAYKTLSRHKKFNSVDFSTLVGKLTTRGMQVEVQSVANVLRELDRRLYN